MISESRMEELSTSLEDYLLEEGVESPLDRVGILGAAIAAELIEMDKTERRLAMIAHLVALQSLKKALEDEDSTDQN